MNSILETHQFAEMDPLRFWIIRLEAPGNHQISAFPAGPWPPGIPNHYDPVTIRKHYEIISYGHHSKTRSQRYDNVAFPLFVRYVPHIFHNSQIFPHAFLHSFPLFAIKQTHTFWEQLSQRPGFKAQTKPWSPPDIPTQKRSWRISLSPCLSPLNTTWFPDMW